MVLVSTGTGLPRLYERIPIFYDTGKTSTGLLRPETVLVVNLGKNKTSLAESSEHFIFDIKTFGRYADVLVIDVSHLNAGAPFMLHGHLCVRLMQATILLRYGRAGTSFVQLYAEFG